MNPSLKLKRTAETFLAHVEWLERGKLHQAMNVEVCDDGGTFVRVLLDDGRILRKHRDRIDIYRR